MYALFQKCDGSYKISTKRAFFTVKENATLLVYNVNPNHGEMIHDQQKQSEFFSSKDQFVEKCSSSEARTDPKLNVIQKVSVTSKHPIKELNDNEESLIQVMDINFVNCDLGVTEEPPPDTLDVPLCVHDSLDDNRRDIGIEQRNSCDKDERSDLSESEYEPSEGEDTDDDSDDEAHDEHIASKNGTISPENVTDISAEASLILNASFNMPEEAKGNADIENTMEANDSAIISTDDSTIPGSSTVDSSLNEIETGNEYSNIPANTKLLGM
ncbi:hypothetical protein RN001_000243 [Aquatica leii]|uniref:Uncharacterized protein n=1 Tax=Aquatica leii TaxID=1421715 RepID=A0AAN7Q6X1_9COLE|nr:hypothetical protein RN001_000243 [Aquatica leii]